MLAIVNFCASIFSAIKKGETTKGAFIENYAAMSLPIFAKWLI